MRTLVLLRDLPPTKTLGHVQKVRSLKAGTTVICWSNCVRADLYIQSTKCEIGFKGELIWYVKTIIMLKSCQVPITYIVIDKNLCFTVY